MFIIKTLGQDSELNISRLARNAEERMRSKKYQKEHKEQIKKNAREWYIKNRERIKEKSKKYYKDHREACRARRKLWGIKNRERIRKYNKEYKRKHKMN